MKPICLPYHDDLDDNYRRDKNGVDLEAVIAGWGATVNKGKSFSIEYFFEYLVNIFVPTTPNPTSGFLLMFPKEEIVYLDMDFEEASKFIVSAGTSNPKN